MNIKKIDKDLDFLRQISKEVNLETDDLTQEISDLEKYVLETNGFAIAAIQLGYNNRVIYIRCSDYTKVSDRNYNEAEVLINPKITKREGLTTYWEACLSCLDNTALVCRPYKIHLEYFDINGNKKEKEILDFPSTVLSHECDHLDGILHMDKALEVLSIPKEERSSFRTQYGYDIYEKDGNFEKLILKYNYDSKTKKLILKEQV